MRPSWIKIIVSLAALWAVTAGIMWALNLRKPTAEKVAAFVESQPLEGKSEEERKRFIEQVAAKVNALEPEERNQSRAKKALDAFWKTLSSAEKGHYFNLVVPRGLQQAIERFNAMDPIKRKKEIEKAVADMRKNADGDLAEDVDPALVKRFVDEGLKSFYKDASIEAKMDAMPLIEELEKSLKWKR